ncbi:MAG: Crp/Fnr family transcriptional regulator [Gammaproteobacteria bacterium]|nr:Crp/Fnr family transcriptional regulator [Gammaproteobacteria bacterium]
MNRTEKRLREILGQLPDAQAEALLDYAEFLVVRHGGTPPPSERLDIPRPASESVVKAIQRLGATYPMLDRSKMLNETSVLMAQHVMQGRDAVEVIDELEALFHRNYEKFANPGK